LFADDTNFFVFGDSLADIENQSSNYVCALNNWFVSNKLSLNLSKTYFMIFSPNQNRCNVILKQFTLSADTK